MRGLQIIVLLIILFLFRSWFIIGQTLSSGDWPYLFLEQIKEFTFIPSGSVLWLTPYYQITAKLFVEYFGLSWELSEKLFWFWPFLAISIFASYYLTKSWIGVLIYTTNTYILMIVGGGQMGVAMSYAFAPFVVGSFISLTKTVTKLKIIIFTLLLSILTMFDARIGFVLLFFLIFYWLFFIIVEKEKSFGQALKHFFLTIVIPYGIIVVLHLYWILPLLHGSFSTDLRNSQSIEGFEFFSFADFSHTFSLLHPNYPENIFGKVYFMRPEFLLLPILAFSILLFKRSKPSLHLLYFCFLGLLGAFLSKGINPPFGIVNAALFQHIPGMNIVRDPTKYYLLVSLSYSYLIPAVIQEFSRTKKIMMIACAVFIIYWCFTIRGVLIGPQKGTFLPQPVPRSYLQMKDFLEQEPSFFETLWVPEVQRFGIKTSRHPAISGKEYFHTSEISVVLQQLKDDKVVRELKEQKVHYIILPYDSKQEIFLRDRKYAPEEYKKTSTELRSISSLDMVKQFGEIEVYILK